MAVFPRRLFEILSFEDPKILSWNEDGKSFSIHNTSEFTNKVLPRYFRHSKLTSFQRQLNLYGFQRIHVGPLEGAYHHIKFQKGNFSLIASMKRNVRKTGEKYDIHEEEEGVEEEGTNVLHKPHIESSSTSIPHINRVLPNPFDKISAINPQTFVSSFADNLSSSYSNTFDTKQSSLSQQQLQPTPTSPSPSSLTSSQYRPGLTQFALTTQPPQQGPGTSIHQPRRNFPLRVSTQNTINPSSSSSFLDGISPLSPSSPSKSPRSRTTGNDNNNNKKKSNSFESVTSFDSQDWQHTVELLQQTSNIDPIDKSLLLQQNNNPNQSTHNPNQLSHSIHNHSGQDEDSPNIPLPIYSSSSSSSLIYNNNKNNGMVFDEQHHLKQSRKLSSSSRASMERGGPLKKERLHQPLQYHQPHQPLQPDSTTNNGFYAPVVGPEMIQQILIQAAEEPLDVHQYVELSDVLIQSIGEKEALSLTLALLGRTLSHPPPPPPPPPVFDPHPPHLSSNDNQPTSIHTMSQPSSSEQV